jgi:Ca2+-binding RTX toxin-like protein
VLGGTTAAENIDGLAGNDTINGGGGLDTLTGGLGNDQIHFNQDAVQIAGGADTDTLVVASGSDLTFDLSAANQYAGAAVNSLNNKVNVTGFENIDGTDAQIMMTVTDSSVANEIRTGVDDDTITMSKGGNDTVYAGQGDDTVTLTTGNGNNVVYGEAGNDTITAGTGNDNLDGGAGDDTFSFGDAAANLTANDTVVGGAGTDTLAAGAGNFDATAVVENFSGIDGVSVNTTAGARTVTLDDTFVGQSDSDSVLVSSNSGGNIVNVSAVVSSSNTVVLQGGAGTDTFNLVDGVNSMVTLATTEDQDSDGLTSDETGVTVTDGTGNDTITGGDSKDTITLSGNGNNVVTGGDGNDTITAGTGDDNIDAGDGDDTVNATALDANDTLEGGLGDDTLNFTMGAAGAGIITGFETFALTFTDGTPGTFDATNVAATDFQIKNGGTATDGEAMKVTNMAAGSTVDFQSASEDIFTLSLEDESGGTDAIDVTFSAAIGNGTNGGLVISENVENLNLMVGAATDLSAESTIKADAINVESVTGNTDNLNLGTLGADVTTVNAGSFAGNLMVTTGTGDQVITGGSGADTLDGGAGADEISGGAGDDQITMRDATDVLDGGADTDTLVVVGNVAEGTAALGVDLSVATDQITNFKGSGTQDVSNFESVDLSGYVGTGANVTGSSAANTITGTGKDDVIEAGDGNDTLTGGEGADLLTGGAGNDTYVTEALGDDNSALTGLDTIVFNVNTESDVLDIQAFTQITEAEMDGGGSLTVTDDGAKVLVDGLVLTLAAAGDVSTFTSGGNTYLVIEDGSNINAFNVGEDYIVILGSGSDITGLADGDILGS